MAVRKKPLAGGRRSRPTRRYRVASGVAHREIDGTLLLLSPSDGQLLTTNAAGALIWRRLARGGATVDDLTTLVSDHFGIPPARAATDVSAFLERLVAGAFVAEA